MANRHPKLKVKMKPRIVYSWVMRNNTTMRSIADRLNISPTYFSQLLHNVRYPNAERRTALLKIMRPMKWDDLFEEDL